METENRYNFTEAMLLGERLIHEGKTLRITAGGNSMFPFIRKGDILFIKKVAEENYKIGDVVVFKTRDKFVAHRLLQVKHNEGLRHFICKGDSLTTYDPPILFEAIIGKVTMLLRNNKEISFISESGQLRNQRIAKMAHLLMPFYWILWLFYKVYRKVKMVLSD